MDTETTRKTFLTYFTEHTHLEAPSSSLVPDEPSLLLTNSGMVQMMPYLLMEKNPPHIRMCSIQKCFRTGDIEDVGKDGRHLTFFEMLGSWSFGDYYKPDAIHLALDLLVTKYHFDKNNIWISVFKGEHSIPEDGESITYWLKEGIPMNRIVKLGWKDNFWGPPGETGPCGPSTEIYYDMGEALGCGEADCMPGCDCDRFMEIWNAGVFMEYYKDAYGNFTPLPQKNVDTGAGLERMTAFLQHKTDVFDTDLLRQIVDKICFLLHIEDYDTDPIHKRAVKIIADHTRAAVFLIADGVVPSNEHRGYILRKLLRRALTQIKVTSTGKEIFSPLANLIITLYNGQYPTLASEKETIISILEKEEQKFTKTLDAGIRNIQKIYKTKGIITGEDIFTLQDTFGIPPEISELLMEGLQIKTDNIEWKDAYKAALETQRTRSRIGSTFTLGKVIEEAFKDIEPTKFTGYTSFTEETDTVKTTTTDDVYLIVLTKTPMYAESGGQAGDMGTITFPTGEVQVTNVKKTKRGIFVHIVPRNDQSDTVMQHIEEKQHVTVVVDEINRRKSSYNHTATHLLHYAIRQVLGANALQRGSYLNADKLRFDFASEKEISADDIKEIERIVNERISKNDSVHIEEMAYDKAKKLGAIGLFENKYGSEVRSVGIGDYSLELCGGTHATKTGELGSFKILKVESISKGIKRIRAVLS